MLRFRKKLITTSLAMRYKIHDMFVSLMETLIETVDLLPLSSCLLQYSIISHLNSDQQEVYGLLGTPAIVFLHYPELGCQFLGLRRRGQDV